MASHVLAAPATTTTAATMIFQPRRDERVGVRGRRALDVVLRFRFRDFPFILSAHFF